MSTAFEPSSHPVSLPPDSADRPESAYRASAALACATCGASAGADYTFTTSGDVQCRPCGDRALHAIATDAAGRAGDMAGERLCGCGGVASAGQMVDHVANQQHRLYGMPVVSDKIEMGSETVFACAACGNKFALLNRLRRVRIAVSALKVVAIGFAVGLLALAIVPGVFGALAFGAVVLASLAFGAAPLGRDALLRRRYPPLG
jgi:DNA-directed RNA polymerase subunit RPC12/RpoP